MRFIEEALEEYVWQNTQPIEEIFERLERETYDRCPNPRMQVGKVEGMFLRMLVAITGAKRVLELGTFTGYSALMMAAALPDGGVVYTLESNERHARIASRYFSQVDYGGRIRIIMGDARKTIDTIEPPIDMAFIDADKVSYDFYYEKVMDLLRPGGLIVMDNMLQGGEVLDPRDESAVAIDRLNRRITDDPRAENVLLTVRDGLMLVRKR